MSTKLCVVSRVWRPSSSGRLTGSARGRAGFIPRSRRFLRLLPRLPNIESPSSKSGVCHRCCQLPSFLLQALHVTLFAALHIRRRHGRRDFVAAGGGFTAHARCPAWNCHSEPSPCAGSRVVLWFRGSRRKETMAIARLLQESRSRACKLEARLGVSVKLFYPSKIVGWERYPRSGTRCLVWSPRKAAKFRYHLWQDPKYFESCTRCVTVKLK